MCSALCSGAAVLSACATAARGLRAAVQVVVFMNEASQVAVRDLRALLARMGEKRPALSFLGLQNGFSWLWATESYRADHPQASPPQRPPTTLDLALGARGWQHSGKPVRAVPRRARSHDASQRCSLGRTALHNRVNHRKARARPQQLDSRAAPKPCPVGSTTSGGATSATPARTPCERRNVRSVARRRRGRGLAPFRTGGTCWSI